MQVTWFIYADKAKGVKRLLFSPQYIEHKISIFNEISFRMKERKNIVKRLVEVIRPLKTGLIPNWSLEQHKYKISVKHANMCHYVTYPRLF